MPAVKTSRQRYQQYRLEAAERRKTEKSPGPVHGGPTKSTFRSRSSWQLLRSFWSLLSGHRGAIIFALGTLTVATLLKLIPPAATKITIDYVLGDHPLPERLPAWLPTDRRELLLALAVAVLAISLVESLLHIWGRWHATLATKRVQVSVRRRTFQHAMRLPLHRVYQLKSGGVASILREDAGGVAELIFNLVYNPWSAVIQLVGSLLVLVWVDWRLLLGSLVLLPLVYFTHRTWISRIRPLHRDVRNQRQQIDSHATEAFGGMRVVRGFGRARSETGRFTRGNHLMARQELHVWWWNRGVELVWEILAPVASAALLVYGGWSVLDGHLSVGDLMMFLFYLVMLLTPVAVLANSATVLQNNLAALDRVLDLLEEDREMPAAPDSLHLDPASVRGRISLQGVGFQYPGSDKAVLQGIDLDVQPGQMVALVGPSGAGKTTLCNLVARFYDPSEGSIELDGIDLRRIVVDSYRKLLGIVEQDIFLFDGTIAENIGYGARHATRKEIEHAARLANAHEFIAAMELGYETIIGERGVRLSGGQRQRLAIARAILANPRILILDEATSNLDTESERLIQQSLATLMEGRTTFVIAHRLSTIAHADVIVVLEAGHIVETGTHYELMSTSSRYRDMVRLQMGLEDEVGEEWGVESGG